MRFIQDDVETSRLRAIGVVLAVLVAVACPLASAQQHRPIRLAGESPTAPLTPGIVAGNTLYISGLQGKGANGKLVSGGFLAQARAALENVQAVVRNAGFQMQDVVSVNIYITDMHNFAAMNKLYSTFFHDPKPTRTTVQAAALANGAQFEISAIAVKSK